MKVRIGIFCSLSDNSLTTNRRFRLENLSYENVINTFLKNLEDLRKLLEFSKLSHFEIFRIGSYLVPFFSHRKFKDKWKYEVEDILKSQSNYIKSFNIRLTMHPPQFVILNSPKRQVVENSIKELMYHFFILDSLDLDENSIIIIHIGGKYENKQKSIDNFINTIENYSFLKRRLAIENDDKIYTVRDVLEISKYTNLPVVFDFFHHRLNPSDFDISEVIETWGKRIPKFHISSQGRKKYEHSDYLEISDLEEFLKLFKNKNITIDLMPEVKMKEKSCYKILDYLNENKNN
ncbi:MAG: UV DNA damage repair endonuclease UvsE [candidate division WOR-3 bacterium]|nr:UV DNA damage repair endonuclease UvsE [candidate division WOR-3 bacterium]MCX7947161.1 UV DNA damage repair endonuclease UvsE [candidate division WOR-3 bacterium]MDW8150217.1 UV DNA damage repair endonuclease UvsE [candidate division WOR-3 bacterium]